LSSSRSVISGTLSLSPSAKTLIVTIAVSQFPIPSQIVYSKVSSPTKSSLSKISTVTEPFSRTVAVSGFKSITGNVYVKLYELPGAVAVPEITAIFTLNPL
jgi:hypothetical protein